MTRQQATQLWRILDKDGSGQISKDEFGEALTGMHRARAWLRYCPDCIYQNTCAYCLETNSNCPNCNENAYCAACWADHPARHRAKTRSSTKKWRRAPLSSAAASSGSLSSYE